MIGMLTNQKGGVGKTTNTIHLGSALAEIGYKVLLIDFDKQCNLSLGLGINELDNGKYNVIDFLENSGNFNVKQKANNLFIIRGSTNFTAHKYKIDVLKKALYRKFSNGISAVDYFDFIFMDCPPADISNEKNKKVFSPVEIALYASNFFLMPLKAEMYSVVNANIFLGKIFDFATNYELNLKFLGFFFSIILVTKKSHDKYRSIIEEKAKELLFNSFIRQDVSVDIAVEKGETIFQYKPNSRAALDYRQLTKEFIDKINIKVK